jgi:hypothetical protein
MARETVGKYALKALEKEPVSRDPIEIERMLHQDYDKNMFECLDRCKKEFDGDFYIVVITKKEPLMQNVLRHYFFGRISCPTPDYDQTVYKFSRATEVIEFIWVVPSRECCLTLRENVAEVAPAEYPLLDFVLKFADGTLFKLAKQLNGEAEDSSLLVT